MGLNFRRNIASSYCYVRLPMRLLEWLDTLFDFKFIHTLVLRTPFLTPDFDHSEIMAITHLFNRIIALLAGSCQFQLVATLKIKLCFFLRICQNQKLLKLWKLG
ncbi:Hypothetical_protein [Hexamita inflata]|uniref:Hypothetical_protein n=1 Tax=Hexamita inflata TaxID=28002 RepID=A0ABP1HPN6_9EUKA